MRIGRIAGVALGALLASQAAAAVLVDIRFDDPGAPLGTTLLAGDSRIDQGVEFLVNSGAATYGAPLSNPAAFVNLDGGTLLLEQGTNLTVTLGTFASLVELSFYVGHPGGANVPDVARLTLNEGSAGWLLPTALDQGSELQYLFRGTGALTVEIDYPSLQTGVTGPLLLDSLTITEVPQAAIPEPGSFAALLTGCIALGSFAVRRRRVVH
jgi:hypothetical protein